MSSTPLIGYYDYRLVTLSVLIAMLAAYAALDLGGRVTSARGGVRRAWLGCGAFAMGLGIWSMHYIGMLAFKLPVPVLYDWPMVLISLLAAIFASGVALYVVSRKVMTLRDAFVGSVFMGTGIALMHYIGMEAMRLPAMCMYAPRLVTLSVVLAIFISFVALWLTYALRAPLIGWGWRKFFASLVMGAAIPVMHYVGMAAATFMPARLEPSSLAHSVSISHLGVLSILITTVTILGLVLITSMVDRRFSVQALELESSEERYRLIVETAFDAFLGVDSDGRMTEWNAQAETTFGWTRAEALGKHWATFFLNEMDAESGRTLNEIFTSGRTDSLHRKIEATAIHRDGRKFPVEIMLSAVCHGQQQLFAAFVHDVTERKAVEEEREKVKQAAEAASRAKSDFLANMSHEIRTPLNGVIGMTDLVLESDLSREQREYLETVKLSADALLNVINEILDFSKIEAGRLELEQEDFDLRDCMESTLKTLALKADEKSLELLCDVSPEVPVTVNGDSVRLRQVLTNLVGNALKFTRHGEVGLKATVESKDESSLVLHFVVSDTGIGIPAEKLHSIFESFAQADTSTTREYGGSGLGLTISRRLVEMMGGKIWVESKVGDGSQFHFTLRAVPADTPTLSAPVVAPPQAQVLHGVKVLIVDDNRTNRRILDGLLRHWKMRPTTVEDGEQALDKAMAARDDGEPFDLILTDMQMPRMDGFDLIEQIRQRPGLVSATIMMLTSGGQRGDARRCDELGVAAHLLKPVRQSELRDALIRVLGAKDQVASGQSAAKDDDRPMRGTARSLRILLAEDNPVNQLLATRLLEKRGHTVTVTGNGLEALNALENQAYDMVLMDVQMPIMDGMAATIALRERETLSGAHMPVIALTAMVIKGDRERCLAAGMDGYLSKPIRQQELDDMLEQYAATLPETRVSKPQPLPKEAENVDEAALMERLGGDLSFLSELTEIFRLEYPKQLLAAKKALAEMDSNALMRAGHALRGTLANLAANHACQTAGLLEEGANTGDFSAAGAAINRLEGELREVLASLESLSQGTPQ